MMLVFGYSLNKVRGQLGIRWACGHVDQVCPLRSTLGVHCGQLGTRVSLLSLCSASLLLDQDMPHRLPPGGTAM